MGCLEIFLGFLFLGIAIAIAMVVLQLTMGIGVGIIMGVVAAISGIATGIKAIFNKISGRQE